MRTQRLFTVLVLALGLTLAVLAGLHIARAAPAATILFARSTGSGSACTQSAACSLQTALSMAVKGSTIYVAQGVYVGSGSAVVTVTKGITLYGGWNGAKTGPIVRAPAIYPTTLDGQGQRRVIYISGNITPTLDGFIIKRGNATGLIADCTGTQPDGCGGGIFVLSGHPVIVNNVIRDNVAAVATFGFPTGTTGFGGGIYLEDASRAVISDNLIISNTGSTVNCGSGGGIHLSRYGDNDGARVQSNQVLSNHATLTDVVCAWGGGISGGPDGVVIQDNLIEGNRNNDGGGGWGVGLYQPYGSAYYRGNQVRGNSGGTAVYLSYSRSRFEGNRVVNNLTSAGVFLQYGDGSGPTLVNNVIASNGNKTLWAEGTAAYPLTITLIHNTLVGDGTGSGVYVGKYVSLRLTNTVVASHTWGVTNTFPASSTVAADYTLFWANSYPGLVGTHPLTGNPAFTDPSGGDYHIYPNSAALNQGANAGVTTDVDGEARPNGAKPDIGADEFYCYALTGVSIAGPTTGITDTATAFTATVGPPTATSLVTYTWQASGQAPVTHTFCRLSDAAAFSWSIAATHTVTVTAVNCGGSDVATHTIAIRPEYRVYLPLVLRDF